MRRLGFVVGAAVVSHLPALGAGYVWLDHAHLEDGAALARPREFLQLFTHGFAGTGYYRPLMALSLSLDALVGGPGVHHAVSVLWHAAAAALVTIAGETLGLTRRAALLAGLLFAVHPVSSLVADAIAFRSEAMVLAGLLALLHAHVRGRPLLAGAAMLFAALTKETGLLLGPLLVLALLASAGPPSGPKRSRVLAAEGGAVVGALVLRLRFAPPWRATHASLSVADQVGTRLAAVAKSAAAVVGVERSICDAFPVTHPWQPTALAGAVVLGAAATFAWKRRGLALLLALSILPALQIVPVTRWWSPHYLYVPLAFLALLVARWAERADERRLRLGAAVGLLALAGLSIHDALRYADDTSLWTPEVRQKPACREAQFYLGEVERSAQRWDAAARRYEAALAERPGILSFVDRGAALQNLGTVRFEQRRFADARRAYEQALEGTRDEPRRRELIHNLAGAALAEGDAAEAVRLLEPECARPDALRASLVLEASALRRLGRADEARVLEARAGVVSGRE